MFIEMIDLLRCTREHEDSWLVAAFTRVEHRFVVEGTLGCHVCGASYPVRDGVADMRHSQPSGAGDTPVWRPHDVIEPHFVQDTGGDALRFAALIGLTRPGSVIVIEGAAAMAAPAVSEIAEARVIALNPPDALSETDRVALVLSAGRIPLAAASVDGIVAATATQILGDAARVLRPGGRLVADARAALGGSFREIARDDRHVVAESVGPLIPLRR